MRYFVTGATGFIGGRVVRQLTAQGDKVAAIVRDPAKAGELTALGVEVFPGDITDKDSLRAPMAGADGVFHMAAWYKVGAKNSSQAESINVGGTRNVLEVMRDLKVPKGVYTSTLAVFSDTRGKVVDESYRHDGPWLSEYDRTKWLAHYQVALPLIEAGLPLMIVQPGLVYGPGDTSSVHTIFQEYLRRKLPISPKGAAFCWAHVDDTARGHVLAMERGAPGQSYIIAGAPHTLEEALALCERITGVPAPKIHPGPAAMRAMAGVMAVLEKLVPVPDSYRAESLRVIAGVTYLGSNAKAKRELGYEPRPLEEGLRETLAYEMSLLGMSPKAIMQCGDAFPDHGTKEEYRPALGSNDRLRPPRLVE